ncbi:restriction endonuclease [Streptomyces fradiae]|uniref:restriction endonuclease n=1 Tax=Streptomyces fradiae TaxID=1906 RepID=UPI0029421C9C|nr:restriction endonuclease [Streptomyces fradiae]WOI60614.1 restriction endonuclease [Streptomyces fradiae]
MAVVERGDGRAGRVRQVRRAGHATGRDVVLAVGLMGAVVGGLALLARTVWTGSYGAFGSVVLALAVGVVAVVVRRVAAARGDGGSAPSASGGAAWAGGGAPGSGDGDAAASAGAAGPAAVSGHGTGGPVAPGLVEGALVEGGASDGGGGATGAGAGAGALGAVPAVGGGVAAVPVLDGEAVDHDAVDPQGFEHTVAALCVRDGCTRSEVSGGPGDLGADVVATTPDGRRLVVQCKQYGADHPVGSADLQRFGGTCFAVHEAEVAVVVTTSTFTAPAVEYAAALGIVCVDGEALAAWTDGGAPPPWEEARP